MALVVSYELAVIVTANISLKPSFFRLKLGYLPKKS